jgi:hypothetical protein
MKVSLSIKYKKTIVATLLLISSILILVIINDKSKYIYEGQSKEKLIEVFGLPSPSLHLVHEDGEPILELNKSVLSYDKVQMRLAFRSEFPFIHLQYNELRFTLNKNDKVVNISRSGFR